MARIPSDIFLSQCKYALDVLSEASMLGCKPLDTPMEQNHNLARVTGALMKDPDRSRHLVGHIACLFLCYSSRA